MTGDGSHFQAIVVGELFAGASHVKKQQTVYAPLMEYIGQPGRIHALAVYQGVHLKSGGETANSTDFGLFCLPGNFRLDNRVVRWINFVCRVGPA